MTVPISQNPRNAVPISFKGVSDDDWSSGKEQLMLLAFRDKKEPFRREIL